MSIDVDSIMRDSIVMIVQIVQQCYSRVENVQIDSTRVIVTGMMNE